MKDTHFDIIAHALGVPDLLNMDRWRKNTERVMYRNRFIAGPDHDDIFVLTDLVALGYMQNDHTCFCVTPTGIREFRADFVSRHKVHKLRKTAPDTDLLLDYASLCTRGDFEPCSKEYATGDETFKQYPGRVPVGEYFLCDLIGGQVNLCRATRRQFMTPDGRLVACKLICTIIPDCHASFGTALNGMWQIPSKFFKR